jgi:alanyl-tRNA synthetase
MNRKELIKKYIDFFKSKDHAEIKNSSLVPENDPTVLFTTAGMHPLVPFLLGQPHPQGKRLVNVQRCIRTGDIDEVGDTTHHTFFEMTGNWSLGDYWKEKAIAMSFEFATKELELPINRIAVTVFGGDKDFPQIPIDNESSKIWESLGIPKEKIAFLKGGVATSKENWWGPAGSTGPCGPCTELFYWKPNNIPVPDKFDAEDENWVEIWNDVLMEYTKDKDGNFNQAEQQNIDNGRGLERMLAVVNKFEDNYLTEVWQPLIKKIEELSGKKYTFTKGTLGYEEEPECWKADVKSMRIIADHIKAACFIINDGIVPGNTEQGYVLRRLIRRAIRSLRKLEVNILEINATDEIAKEVFKIYDDYNLKEELILSELKKEEDKFQKTLDKGLREFEKMGKDNKIDGKESFLLYQSYGFPLEMIEEMAKEKGIAFNPENFKEELKKHQKLSQTASAGKFKSGLGDNTEATTKLHTATHMLLAALKKVLGQEINQKGSNITSERLRFDFNLDRKMTLEEKAEVEKLVNEEIQKGHKITREEMTPAEAKVSGATGVFDDKYEGIVSVYTIGPIDAPYSKEICTGPHIESTKNMGIFKIKKEESSSSGVRRIKAVLI